MTLILTSLAAPLAGFVLMILLLVLVTFIATR